MNRATKKNSTRKSKTSRNPDADIVPETIPPARRDRFPVVGIGASAGGLGAFEAFFSAMPADKDPDMAFVLVQHLAPDHKSLLSELIQRYTRMRVCEVEDGMVVEPNCAYIIPPNHDMSYVDGTLQLLEFSSPREQRMPIDFFFRSLARHERERAIGIILSGTGSDGTLGVRAIKGEGGMVMVQRPETADFDGMPCSSLATGQIDFSLPPEEMPTQLIQFATHFHLSPLVVDRSLPANRESVLKKIFLLLREQTGHDFTLYKPSTIHRRIERRMALQQIQELEQYLMFLQKSSSEIEQLFQDLLIGVTSFFRDPESFQALEDQVLPLIFSGKPAGSLIRVWSTGCSTGEEAYSLAILLQEQLDILKQGYKVQVFATDLDGRAIATARSGVYPASIAPDVSPGRLRHYFVQGMGTTHYRVQKTIREMMIFSEQNLIQDPPFSKLDLICCRNLLIYLSLDVQKKVFPLFHYALNPGGCLFLGSSETIGDSSDLFTVLDRKHKLYQRRSDMHTVRQHANGRFTIPITAIDYSPHPPIAKLAVLPKIPVRELTERILLQEVSRVGILINSRGDILYLHGRSGQFLEPSSGESGINNVLKMARIGLRQEIATGLHRIIHFSEVIRQTGLRVKTNGSFITANLIIRPAVVPGILLADQEEQSDVDQPLYMIILEEVPDDASPHSEDSHSGQQPTRGSSISDEQITLLKQELQAKEDYLQVTNEELETSNEELKSANEEMQSVNEELQSSNEELQTSKEELQSVNEELATVNAELQTKVVDLSRANNDLNNLLAGTGIATVFLDLKLQIMRFTPAATRIINLIPSDAGRPLAHVVANLVEYDDLIADAQTVLETLIPRKQRVQTTAGVYYQLGIQPYRTIDNVIEGIVLTFVEAIMVAPASDS